MPGHVTTQRVPEQQGRARGVLQQQHHDLQRQQLEHDLLVGQVRDELDDRQADRLVIALERALELRAAAAPRSVPRRASRDRPLPRRQPARPRQSTAGAATGRHRGRNAGRQTLTLTLNRARACSTSRCSSSSPISGNLVLTTATSAANTGVYVGDAIWLFMTLRQNRPRARTRFCAHARAAPRQPARRPAHGAPGQASCRQLRRQLRQRAAAPARRAFFAEHTRPASAKCAQPRKHIPSGPVRSVQRLRARSARRARTMRNPPPARWLHMSRQTPARLADGMRHGAPTVSAAAGRRAKGHRRAQPDTSAASGERGRARASAPRRTARAAGA